MMKNRLSVLFDLMRLGAVRPDVGVQSARVFHRSSRTIDRVSTRRRGGSIECPSRCVGYCRYWVEIEVWFFPEAWVKPKRRIGSPMSLNDLRDDQEIVKRCGLHNLAGYFTK
jgi:hypothetical protein